MDLNPEKFEIGTCSSKKRACVDPIQEKISMLSRDCREKFGLTDFINPSTCGEKSVSQVSV